MTTFFELAVYSGNSLQRPKTVFIDFIKSCDEIYYIMYCETEIKAIVFGGMMWMV